ncbi:MAG TPA: tetratricopeptide repeat protein [Acidiferrobacterales bacterium]
MSVKQARNLLATELKGSLILNSGRIVPITDVRARSNRLIVTDENGKQSIFIYRELPQISVGLGGLEVGWVLMLAGQHTFSLGRISSGNRDDVPNALHVLQQNAIKQKNESDEYKARFVASLADYRKKAAANIAFPEEANKYKVQAEGAVRDKAFDDAADFYAAALNIAPWWPVGHFNRALVLGEAGEYELARREMNYYLQLVPDAPNARAAQDKIYDWGRLDSK